MIGAVDRMSVAQADAHVLYPAVTSEELADESLLLSSYRRSLGRERMLWGALVVLAGAWAFDYLRRGK